MRWLALLLLCSCSAPQPRLVWLGDSIVQAWPLAPAFAPFRPLNLGHAGDRTADTLRVVGRLTVPASGIMLEVGSNDLRAGALPPDVAARVLAVAAALRARYPAAPLLVLGVLPRAGLEREVRETNRLLSEALGEDFADPGAGLPLSLLRDGIHPTAEGYRWLDAQLLEQVRALVGDAGGIAFDEPLN